MSLNARTPTWLQMVITVRVLLLFPINACFGDRSCISSKTDAARRVSTVNSQWLHRKKVRNILEA